MRCTRLGRRTAPSGCGRWGEPQRTEGASEVAVACLRSVLGCSPVSCGIHSDDSFKKVGFLRLGRRQGRVRWGGGGFGTGAGECEKLQRRGCVVVPASGPFGVQEGLLTV
jgi:hypothetical protein